MTAWIWIWNWILVPALVVASAWGLLVLGLGWS